jgi:hypothetical protein
MFSLIITIISIALVAALALATIYYGGSAFRQGGDAALAAQYINEGQQLSGAAAIVEANGGAVSTQAALVTAKGLQSAIANYDDAVDVTNRAFVSKKNGAAETVPANACVKINEKAGLSPAPADVASVKSYGCIPGATATDPGKMVFKY